MCSSSRAFAADATRYRECTVQDTADGVAHHVIKWIFIHTRHSTLSAAVYAGAPAALCRLQVQVQKPLVAPEVPSAALYQTSCSCRPPKGWPLAACRCWRGCCHQCLPEGWSSAGLLPHRRPGPHCGRCRLQGRGSNRPQRLARAAYTACMCVGLVSADASKGECRSGSTGRCADFQGYSCMPLTCMP
jgi:hypothetical protein